MTISPAQCRAARALLNITQEQLAKRATLSRKTVADFEQENREVHARSKQWITDTLTKAGIVLVPGGVKVAA